MAGRRVAYRKTSSERLRKPRPLILTVGYSTRERKEFIRLLRAHGVEQLVDVRTIPRSRYNPQFNRATLSRALRQAGIAYLHMDGLGGLRHSRRDSINTGWRNKSFRGYADYMQTPDFRSALRTLVGLARRKRVALMCAEALPWRCHRSLIADALVIHGFPCGRDSERGANPSTWFDFMGSSPRNAGYISARGKELVLRRRRIGWEGEDDYLRRLPPLERSLQWTIGCIMN